VSVRLLIEEHQFRRYARYLLLVFGAACLSYTGLVYINQSVRLRQESVAFDEARSAIPEVRESQPWKARLSIPRLRLTTMVEEGVDESTLSVMAGHIPGTALPGRPGNVGVAAHRDTHFRSLRGIRKRDRIVISTLTGDYRYEVVSTRIVSPKEVSVLAPSAGQNTLTLVTCYPFNFIGRAPKRFIVRANQLL